MFNRSSSMERNIILTMQLENLFSPLNLSHCSIILLALVQYLKRKERQKEMKWQGILRIEMHFLWLSFSGFSSFIFFVWCWCDCWLFYFVVVDVFVVCSVPFFVSFNLYFLRLLIYCHSLSSQKTKWYNKNHYQS